MALTVNDLALVALTGIMGAPHCFMMCGGISSSLALTAKGSPLKPVLAYNAGRVTTYSAIGGLMGLSGSFLNAAGRFAGLQSIASMLGGLLIILWALRRYTLPIQAHRIPGYVYLHEAANRLRQRYEWPAVYMAGILLGFLPCGLTYAMQMNAAASGSAADGGLMMLVFGLATLPVLLLAAWSAGSITGIWRRRMRKGGTVLMIVMGLLAILKGMSANGWVPAVHPWLW